MILNLFTVGVREAGRYTHITGVSFSALASDIQKFYSTSLITKYLVKRETWDTIKLHNFYLVELHYLLGEMLKIRNLRSRRRDLAELKQLIETETWIKDCIVPKGIPFDFKKMDRFITKLYPSQREFLEQYPLITASYHLKGLALDAAAGSGKAMPLDTLVKIPGGWKKIGDLKIGDPVVGPQGNIATVTGVYPQGVTDVYQFILDDGRQVESHPEHLWQIIESEYSDEEVPETTYVTTTKDIVANFGRFGYLIPAVGHMGGINLESTTEVQTIALNLLVAGTELDDSILELPYNDRYNIVKAMLEGSGFCAKERGAHFVADNHYATNNFQKLIHSIGGRGQCYTGDGKFYCLFGHRDVADLVVNLVVGDIATVLNMEQASRDSLYIRSVWKTEPKETLCISIDSEDKLFVVEDYITTHNTFTALAWAEMVSDQATMILSPLNLLDEVWRKEFVKHFKKPPNVWYSKGNIPIKEGYDYYVVHYDYLHREGFGILKKFLEAYRSKHKVGVDLIVDESHNFNEIKSKQTQRLIELADADLFGNSLPMSGTLFKALGSEAFPIMCLIAKEFDQVARTFFLQSYGRNRPALMDMLAHRIGKSKFTIPEIVGMGEPPPFEIIKVKVPNADKYTLDALRLEMQAYIAERVRFYNKHMPEFTTFYNDVITRYEQSVAKHPREKADLQKYKTIVNRFRNQGYNNFTDSQDSLFCKKVEEDIERDLKGKELKDFRNVKSAVKYLGLKLRGEALGNVLGRARINAIKDMIAYADLPSYIDDVEKKTVIFTSYVESLLLAESHLVSKGYHPVTVYGENSKDRDASVERFRTDPKVNPLGATYDSLKEGYPLIMANQILSLDAPWRDGVIRQVKARIWRIGQDAPCFFRMFDMDTGGKSNIMTRNLDILAWSKEQVDALLGRVDNPAVFANVTGQEMLDLEYEAPTQRLKSSNSVLELFA